MSIDLRELAHSVALCLTPALPYLTAATGSAVKGFAEKVGGAAFHLATRLYQLVMPAISEKPEAREALTDLTNDPNDAAMFGAFEVQLRKIFADNSNLAGQVNSLLYSESNATQILVAVGERSVAARSITQSTVITGDDNILNKFDQSD